MGLNTVTYLEAVGFPPALTVKSKLKKFKRSIKVAMNSVSVIAQRTKNLGEYGTLLGDFKDVRKKSSFLIISRSFFLL